jgi:type II secretory pathway component PulF
LVEMLKGLKDLFTDNLPAALIAVLIGAVIYLYQSKEKAKDAHLQLAMTILPLAEKFHAAGVQADAGIKRLLEAVRDLQQCIDDLERVSNQPRRRRKAPPDEPGGP